MDGVEQGISVADEARRLVADLPAGLEDQRPARIRHKRHSWPMRLKIGWQVRRAVGTGSAAAFEMFRAGLSGDLPAKGADSVILAACNEYYYWHYARAFVASLERAGGKQTVHFHLCRPGAAVLANIGALSKLLSAVSLTWTIDDCRLARELSQPTIYYAASRFLVSPLILEKTSAPLLATDVDGIAMRAPAHSLTDLMKGADVALIERPAESQPTMKILASAVGLGPTPEGRRFAGELGRALASVFALKPRYHVDQITIHALLQRVRPSRSLRVATVPKLFWDHDFGGDAVIWTAKGWTRKESGAFQAAKQEAEAFLVNLAERRAAA